MKKKMKFLFAAMMFAIVLAGVLSHVAEAQLDPGVKYYVYENGVRVAEIHVIDRPPDATQYVEDWVLYPNYLYPGPRFIGALQIIPSQTERPYASESDFLHNVPFTHGSKLVRVTAQEFTSLPVAR